MVAEAWNWEEEKAFENAFAINYETCCDWLEKLAAAVPEKTLEEIKRHYEILIEDVGSIESGRVPLPNYSSPSSSSSSSSSSSVAAEGSGDGGGNGKKCGHSHRDYSIQGGKSSKFEHERRKGIAWTEEEHRLFLLGLDKYGKGDWRSISRNFVISRTPTQVASHAQKYFIRLNSMNKDRRRSSIHDITNVSNGDSSASQGPITGQSNSFSAASAPGIAVGTPVAGLPMAYRVRPPPTPGIFIAGTPVCFTAPVVYPVHSQR